MAKVKFGMMMTDASGKLGGQVFSKNRSGSYVRTKVTPSNPQSVAQQAIRAMLGSVSSAWSELTASQRASFNEAVEDWKKTDIFGDLKKPTGKNLFTSLNVNLLNSEQAMINVAPAKEEIPFLLLSSVAVDISALTMTPVFDGSALDCKVVVSATPPLSAGTSFYKGKFREIAVTEGSELDGFNAWSAYVARFGVPAVGANIAFKLKLIAVNGQAGVAEIATAVVSA